MAFNEEEYKRGLAAKTEEQYKSILQSLGPRFGELLNQETQNIIGQKVPEGLELSGGSFNPKSGLGLQFDMPEPTLSELPPAPGGFEYGSVSGGPEGIESYTLRSPKPEQREGQEQVSREELAGYMAGGRRLGKITVTPGAKSPRRFEFLPPETQASKIKRWQTEAKDIVGKENYSQLAADLGKAKRKGWSWYKITKEILTPNGLLRHHVYNITGSYHGYKPGKSLKSIYGPKKKVEKTVEAARERLSAAQVEATKKRKQSRQSGEPKARPSGQKKSSLRPATKSYPSPMAAGAAAAGERAKKRVKRTGPSRVRTIPKGSPHWLKSGKVPKGHKGLRQVFGRNLWGRG